MSYKIIKEDMDRDNYEVFINKFNVISKNKCIDYSIIKNKEQNLITLSVVSFVYGITVYTLDYHSNIFTVNQLNYRDIVVFEDINFMVMDELYNKMSEIKHDM